MCQCATRRPEWHGTIFNQFISRLLAFNSCICFWLYQIPVESTSLTPASGWETEPWRAVEAAALVYVNHNRAHYDALNAALMFEQATVASAHFTHASDYSVARRRGMVRHSPAKSAELHHVLRTLPTPAAPGHHRRPLLFVGILSAAAHAAHRWAIRRSWFTYAAFARREVVARFLVARSPHEQTRARVAEELRCV